jgi:hypothetical protein
VFLSRKRAFELIQQLTVSSFDFYPMEMPDGSHPLLETRERGVCVLNTGNKDSARLRNEDQGSSGRRMTTQDNTLTYLN